VAQLLEDLLLARFPPARATVGLDAYGAAAVGSFVPDFLMDTVQRLMF
jgi:hypothetical protein